MIFRLLENHRSWSSEILRIVCEQSRRKGYEMKDRAEKMMELHWALSQLMNPNLVEMEVHYEENANYLKSIGFQVERITDGNWWITARPL